MLLPGRMELIDGQHVGASQHGYLLTIVPSCRPSSASYLVERVERGTFARRWRIDGGRGGGYARYWGGGCVYV